VLIMEWTFNSFPGGYGPFFHAGDFGTFHNILINGKGGLTEQPNLDVPLETYTVQKGFRYRFRLINSGIQNCPMSISVDGHRLTVIESDGSPIEPIVVDSLASFSGERYDFIINANQAEADYLIKVSGEQDCGSTGTPLAQRAILRYQRANVAATRISSSTPFTFADSLSNGLVTKIF
jgi:FtsP/CotA-like multicopper oxidase with cupredoxin domain